MFLSPLGELFVIWSLAMQKNPSSSIKVSKTYYCLPPPSSYRCQNDVDPLKIPGRPSGINHGRSLTYFYSFIIYLSGGIIFFNYFKILREKPKNGFLSCMWTVLYAQK